MDVKIAGGCSLDEVIILDDINITEGAAEVLSTAEIHIALFKHVNHDWGFAPDDVVRQNEENVKGTGRVVSCFATSGGCPYMVATDVGEVNNTVIALESEIVNDL